MVERYGLRTVHKHGHVAELLFTFGLAFIIEELVQMIWGKIAGRLPRARQRSNFSAFTLFAHARYPAYRMFMMLMSVAMFIGLLLVLTRTRIGLIIQAALTHPSMVEALGHNVPRVFMLVFGGGCALAGAGRRDRRATRSSPSRRWRRRSGPSCSWWWWSAAWARWPAPSSRRC